MSLYEEPKTKQDGVEVVDRSATVSATRYEGDAMSKSADSESHWFRDGGTKRATDVFYPLADKKNR